jgi:urease accessory protein UreF
LGAALTYLFQSRTSERAEASALQRELRAERMSAYSSYATALAEFKRGQVDWYNRRGEDPNSAATLGARVESYRLKGVAQATLSRVRLVASVPAVVTAATNAFELTRPVHYAQDSDDLRSRDESAEKALNRFIALAAVEIQSAPITGRNR